MNKIMWIALAQLICFLISAVYGSRNSIDIAIASRRERTKYFLWFVAGCLFVIASTYALVSSDWSHLPIFFSTIIIGSLLYFPLSSGAASANEDEADDTPMKFSEFVRGVFIFGLFLASLAAFGILFMFRDS